MDLAIEFNASIQTGKIIKEWLHNYLLPLPKSSKKHLQINGFTITTMLNTPANILRKSLLSKLLMSLRSTTCFSYTQRIPV